MSVRLMEIVANIYNINFRVDKNKSKDNRTEKKSTRLKRKQNKFKKPDFSNAQEHAKLLLRKTPLCLR